MFDQIFDIVISYFVYTYRKNAPKMGYSLVHLAQLLFTSPTNLIMLSACTQLPYKCSSIIYDCFDILIESIVIIYTFRTIYYY